MKKLRILPIVLALVIILSAFSTAASQTVDRPTVVTDMYGREVLLPDTVEKIAAIGGAARILTYAGVADMIVGVTEADKVNDPGRPYSVVNAEHFAGLPSVGQGGANDVTFVEELAVLRPDVVIGMVGDLSVIEDVAAKTGLPVIGIIVDDMFDDKLFASLELIGAVTGRSERSVEVIEYIKVCRDDLHERTKDISKANKPTVYAGAVSFRGGHGITGTAGVYPPFEAIGARNVVAEAGITDFVSVDIEQIAVWDPDIIFLNPANMEMVEVDYSNHKAFFDNLSAVKNGQLYPQLPYNSNWSNLEIAIADTYYAGKIIFPEQFADIDPIEKTEEIFTVMLGEPFYDKLAAVGYTFEQMTIGSGE